MYGVNYDDEANVLYISLKDTSNSYGDSFDNYIILRDVDTDEVTGITLLDFEMNFENKNEIVETRDVRCCGNCANGQNIQELGVVECHLSYHLQMLNDCCSHWRNEGVVHTMKVKDLIEKLKNYEDYDVEAAYSDYEEGNRFLDIYFYKVDGIADVSHSDKVVVLSLDSGGGWK